LISLRDLGWTCLLFVPPAALLLICLLALGFLPIRWTLFLKNIVLPFPQLVAAVLASFPHKSPSFLLESRPLGKRAPILDVSAPATRPGGSGGHAEATSHLCIEHDVSFPDDLDFTRNMYVRCDECRVLNTRNSPLFLSRYRLSPVGAR